MKQIKPEDFVTMPWKNGGGITHEIAKVTLGGALLVASDASRKAAEAGTQGEPLLWRLSLADVGKSGPFSLFPGQDRVLYSISGGSMRLEPEEADARGVMQTSRACPTLFAGDMKISGHMPKGSDLIENFNLIYDRAHLEVEASSLVPEESADSKARHWRAMLAKVPLGGDDQAFGEEVSTYCLYCLSGRIGPLEAGEVGLFTTLPAPLSLSEGAEAIVLRLTPLPAIG